MKLKELIVQYAAFRKSMGEDFESAESLLNTFCRRMGVEIDIGEIQAEQVAVFLAGTGPVNRYWGRKYDTLRGLLSIRNQPRLRRRCTTAYNRSENA